MQDAHLCLGDRLPEGHSQEGGVLLQDIATNNKTGGWSGDYQGHMETTEKVYIGRY